MANEKNNQRANQQLTPVTEKQVAASNSTSGTTTEQTPIVTPQPTPAPTPEVTLEPTPKPTSAPSAEPQQSSADEGVSGGLTSTSAITTISDDLEVAIVQLQENGSEASRTLLAGLSKYMENMVPGVPQSKTEGPANQLMLWRTIRGLIEAESEDFGNAWGVMLGLFTKHAEGVFHERYVFRFMDNIAIAAHELSAFQNILDLIRLTADPKTRVSSLKQTDMTRTLAKGFSENGRQRILGFYGM